MLAYSEPFGHISGTQNQDRQQMDEQVPHGVVFTVSRQEPDHIYCLA